MDGRRGVRVLGALACVVLVMGACGPVATPAPSPAPSPTPTPAPTAVAPITPASDEIVVRLDIRDAESESSTPIAILYEDGSLVDLRAAPEMEVRALTRAGVAAVIDRLVSSHLFTSSHAIPLESPPPSDYRVYTITLATSGGLVEVSAADESDSTEAHVLVSLANTLQDPERWLRSTDFVGRVPTPHPYLPRWSMVTSEVVALEPDSWANPELMLSGIPWPLATPATELGVPVEIAGEPDRHLRCAVIPGTDAAVIREALALVPQVVVWGVAGEDQRTSTWSLRIDGPALLGLTLRPFLPHEAADCAAAYLPDAPSLQWSPRPSLAAVLAANAGGIIPSDTQPGIKLTVSRARSDGVGTALRASYLSDGTIVFRDPPPPALGLGALRLNANGLDDLDRRLKASGLLVSDFAEEIPEDAPPYTTFSLVRKSMSLNATDRGRDPKSTAIAELVGHLLDPAAWLPAADFVGDPERIQPFLPAMIHVEITHEVWPGMPQAGTLEGLAWPLAGTLDEFGTRDVSADEALALLRALGAARAGCSGEVTSAQCWLAEGSAWREFRFSIDIGDPMWGFDL